MTVGGFPARSQVDVNDRAVEFTASEIPLERVAWQGAAADHTKVSLSELAWRNRAPEKLFASIGFVSAGVRAAPFFIAVSLGEVKSKN